METSWKPLGGLLAASWGLLKPLGTLLVASRKPLRAPWAILKPIALSRDPLDPLLAASWSPFGASWSPLGGLLDPLGAPLGPSWDPLGGLLEAPTENVGADGAVFNMISSANKKVSETVAPRGPFFEVKNAILYCILQYISHIGLIAPKSDFKRRDATPHPCLKPLGRGKGEG